MVEYIMSREMYENLKKELKTSNNKVVLQYINQTFGIKGRISKFIVE